MAGSQTLRLRGGRLVAALTVAFLTSANSAQAQQPLQPTETQVRDYEDVVEVEAPVATTLVPRPSSYPGMVSSAARVEMGLLDTISESLFGDASAEGKWRPLTFGTFFSEGWREPWAGGPAGQNGLTPRHGWLGSFEGVFYRLWLVDTVYQNNLSKPYGGNGYRGDYAVFLPFSRRFELLINVPFVVANGTKDSKQGYRSDFGDMSVAASFLLSETKASTQLFTLGTILPTGRTETGGNLMTVFPRYSFWSNPGGSWVVRGGAGVNAVLNKNDQRSAPTFTPGGGALFGESSSQTTFNVDVAIGRYFTPHDVAFGDLVFYLNCNLSVPLEDRNRPTFVGVGPGTRFQIVGDWWFLNYWEVALTGDKPFDFQTSAAIVKAF